MNKSRFLILILLVIGITNAGIAAAQQRRDPLTNAAIVKLVRAGFKDKTVIAIIHSRPSRFDLEPERLIDLKRSGVSENVIRAMLARNDSTFVVSDDDGWDDDSFFRNPGRSKPSGNGDSQSEQNDIFGSSGGSNAQQRQGGLNGSSQGDTTTTGSATVRILRPPTEASGAAVKLEKTPTLDNEAIIRLVEAGFSEGTILKRIEDSPANFDLSAPKLLELKKRRVTEAIIAAMTAAMDDSDTKVLNPGTSKEN